MPSYRAYSDNELMPLLQSGDDAAFAEVYNRYWRLMFSLAVTKLNDPEEAKELVQDVFISLWNRHTEIRITHSMKAYLAAAVKLRVYSALSKKYRREALQSDLPEPEVSTRPEIESKLSLDELMQKVELATARLPERCRLIFRLSREENMSHKAIADKLHISEKTVDNQINKALNSLRTTFRTLFSILFSGFF